MGQSGSEHACSIDEGSDAGRRYRQPDHTGGPVAQIADGWRVPVRIYCRRPIALGGSRALAPHAAYRARKLSETDKFDILRCQLATKLVVHYFSWWNWRVLNILPRWLRLRA